MIKDVIIEGGGGGGVSSDDVTAGKAQVLAGYTALTSDSNDEVATGTLPLASVLSSAGGSITTRNDSGNTTLNASTTSKSYAAGYYPNAHGAQVTLYTWS